MSKRTDKEIREDARKLLQKCIKHQTNRIVDKDGTIWEINTWYGEKPHFRSGLGTHGERILDTSNFDVYAPYEPVAALSDTLGKEWRDYFKKEIK